jgi:4-diphosphocytidyl-2-C-methyl-D-erythritol kinase
MVWFPTAKINLGLHVLRKRADGFHDISTCFYPVNWKDILEIIPAGEFSFKSSGLTIPGDKKDNLCIKAYNLLKKEHNLPPVKIHLHKIIPMGAGLGGGSSDAVFTLKGLNELFKLELKIEDLQPYAQQLGSDCPFFLYDQPMMASGRGDELQALDLSISGFKLIIVYPEINVNTASAYTGIKPSDDRVALEKVLKQEIDTWKNDLFNDFEKSVFQLHPQIQTIKEKLYNAGAVYSSMSGSGSAVYGLFKVIPDDLRNAFPACSVFVGG